MSTSTPITFATDDFLNRKPFCEKLERFLLVENDFVKGSLVLALNGGFGSGKTTFLQMWKTDLEERRTQNKILPMPVLLNAWENDFCGDPLLSMLTSLIETMDSLGGADESNNAEKLKEAAKDIGWFTMGLLNGVTSKIGLDAMRAGEITTKKKNERSETTPDFIEAYQQRTKAFQNLKTALKQVFSGPEPKAIIFIDELDRCRPDFAVDYLETIKHVFDIEGLVFILAVDEKHLENSAKSLFGQDLKFPEYFRKFSHRSIKLPEPDDNSWNLLTSKYMEKYLEVAGKRTSALSQDRHRKEQVTELLQALNMKQRDIQESFRIMGHAFACNEENKGRIKWCIGVGTVFLSALKVTNPDLYHRIGTGNVEGKELGEFLISKLGRENASWWFDICITGLTPSPSSSQITTLLRELKFIGPDDAPQNNIGEFASGWSRRNLTYVYKTIEEVELFSNN